jgi:hypothetical protein
MTPFLIPPRIFNALPAAALACLLAACGGGGGGGPAPSNTPVTVYSPLEAGIYSGSLTVQGTASSHPWVTLLTTDSTSGNKWYGWEQTAGGEVALYSGSWAQSPPTGFISSVVAFKNGSTRTGQAGLTGISSRGYSASLSLNRVTTPALAEEVHSGTLSAQAAESFDGLTPLVGTWTGIWRDGPTDSALNATLTIQNSGQLSFSAFVDCAQSSDGSSRLTRLSGLPAFSVELKFAPATICSRRTSQLNGVAILRRSTDPGKTWQLDLMATNPLGSGISFRASR